jgi:hypothetical protein
LHRCSSKTERIPSKADSVSSNADGGDGRGCPSSNLLHRCSSKTECVSSKSESRDRRRATTADLSARASRRPVRRAHSPARPLQRSSRRRTPPAVGRAIGELEGLRRSTRAVGRRGVRQRRRERRRGAGVWRKRVNSTTYVTTSRAFDSRRRVSVLRRGFDG